MTDLKCKAEPRRQTLYPIQSAAKTLGTFMRCDNVHDLQVGAHHRHITQPEGPTQAANLPHHKC
jgi:hypothetical protein